MVNIIFILLWFAWSISVVFWAKTRPPVRMKIKTKGRSILLQLVLTWKPKGIQDGIFNNDALIWWIILNWAHSILWLLSWEEVDWKIQMFCFNYSSSRHPALCPTTVDAPIMETILMFSPFHQLIHIGRSWIGSKCFFHIVIFETLKTLFGFIS